MNPLRKIFDVLETLESGKKTFEESNFPLRPEIFFRRRIRTMHSARIDPNDGRGESLVDNETIGPSIQR